MSIEKVKVYFSQYGMADRVQEFEVSSATVDLAAQALNCEPCRIAKTLSFMVDGHAALIVAAGDAKIDNPKYKAQFGTKAKMLTPDEAETLIGHAVGGVCPFAINEGVTVYLDNSLKRFETVFSACGSSPAFPPGWTCAKGGTHLYENANRVHLPFRACPRYDKRQVEAHHTMEAPFRRYIIGKAGKGYRRHYSKDALGAVKRTD